MRTLLSCLMGSNAALFFFGAIQHAGFSIGPFREPHIVPAAIVETICGISLAAGVVALVRQAPSARTVVVIANLVALGGVLLGMVALSLGRGPRTASNDLYHRIMLVLIAVCLVIVFGAQRRLKRT
jgi:hypothetical protein